MPTLTLVRASLDAMREKYGAEICPSRLFDWAADHLIDLYGGVENLPSDIHAFMQEFDELYARVLDGETDPVVAVPEPVAADAAADPQGDIFW